MPRRGFPPADGPDTCTAGTLFPRRRRRPRGRSTRPAATGRWSCWRTCPASTARRSRCATCSWSTAPRSAAPSSTSTARSCSRGLALPRRRVRRVLQGAEPAHDGARGGGLVRVGHRRRPGRRGGVRRRGRRAAPRPTPGVDALEARLARPASRTAARWQPNWPSCARVRSEKLGEVAAEFDGVHNIHRAVEVGSVDAVISASELRPQIIAAIEAGLA